MGMSLPLSTVATKGVRMPTLPLTVGPMPTSTGRAYAIIEHHLQAALSHESPSLDVVGGLLEVQSTLLLAGVVDPHHALPGTLSEAAALIALDTDLGAQRQIIAALLDRLASRS